MPIFIPIMLACGIFMSRHFTEGCYIARFFHWSFIDSASSNIIKLQVYYVTPMLYYVWQLLWHLIFVDYIASYKKDLSWERRFTRVVFQDKYSSVLQLF